MTSTTTVRIGEAFRALASSQRREILRILGDAPQPDKTCCGPAEVCACKLSERLGLAASTISHHMSVLRDAGLVSARKEGAWVYYTLEREAMETVARELESFFRGESG